MRKGLDGCDIHENCKRSYPCYSCFLVDHPDGGGRNFLSIMCGRHREEARASALADAARIEAEIESLSPAFEEDGIVKTVLRERVAQERQRAEQFA